MKHYQIESNIVRCPNPEYAEKMINAIDVVRVRGDSVGGVVTCIVRRCPRVRTLLSLPPPPPLFRLLWAVWYVHVFFLIFYKAFTEGRNCFIAGAWFASL